MTLLRIRRKRMFVPVLCTRRISMTRLSINPSGELVDGLTWYGLSKKGGKSGVPLKSHTCPVVSLASAMISSLVPVCPARLMALPSNCNERVETRSGHWLKGDERGITFCGSAKIAATTFPMSSIATVLYCWVGTHLLETYWTKNGA